MAGFALNTKRQFHVFQEREKDETLLAVNDKQIAVSYLVIDVERYAN